MVSGHVLREIQKKDDRAVEQIIRSCLIEYGGDREGTAWEDPDLGRFSEIYRGNDRKYWVMEDEDGKILGGSGIGPLEGIPGVCELQKMYCIKEARGTGVAHELIRTALEFAKTRYERCYLETFGNMKAAQKFYEKYGFQRIYEPLGNTGHYGCDVMYIKEL
ncbi:MAG: GNAT family N-acetyltransferase [Lachnospiraceae bacterium]|nr:GNAT family N-acetyltransferase [Lachnospiraceae bacterium]